MKFLSKILILPLIALFPMSHHALAEVVPVYSTDDLGTFFREWLLCGPFPLAPPGTDPFAYQHGPDSEGFFKDHLVGAGGEAKADPKPGATFTHTDSGDEFSWTRYESEADLVSFEKAFGPHDMVVGYAFARIRSGVNARFILSLGSNDGARVFLNGECVHSHNIGRWLGKDTDYIPIDLKFGENTLLVKVTEGGGDWGMCARLLDYEETIGAIAGNLAAHTKLTVITSDDQLEALFGEPYKIETLNPGAEMAMEVQDENGKVVATQAGRPGEPLSFPLDAFADGPLRFRASFPLGNGRDVSAERGHFVGDLPRHNLPSMIRPDLVFQDTEGKPFFPIGTYGASPEDYAMLKEAGYNFVNTSPDNLDKVHAAGLIAMIGFHGDDEAYLKHLEESVRAHKDHPALFCYMLADEPGYNRMDLLNMHKAYELTHEIDPVHPSYLVITDPSCYATVGRCCDVLAIDTYPISKKNPINDVGNFIAKAYGIAEGDLPIWQCGQTFNWPADRVPTVAEDRFMTYLSILEGARGVLWYSLRWQGKSYPEHYPDEWAGHVQMVGEIASIEPFLVSGKTWRTLDVADDKGHVRAKEIALSDTERVVLALNTSTTESTTESIATGGEGIYEALGEGRKVEAKSGNIEDSFEPLEVHVYVITGE